MHHRVVALVDRFEEVAAVAVLAEFSVVQFHLVVLSLVVHGHCNTNG